MQTVLIFVARCQSNSYIESEDMMNWTRLDDAATVLLIRLL